MKLRVLDLFCGAGGAAKGYHDGFTAAGFDVEIVGVDVKPQPSYPYTFVQADVMALVRDSARGCWHEGPGGAIAGKLNRCLGHFDFIHASPPCQAYSTVSVKGKDYPDLYALVRDRLVATGCPYVIENVIGAPYTSGVVLCGSMFGMKVRRHRNFETSFVMLRPDCRHAEQGRPYTITGHGGGCESKHSLKPRASDFWRYMDMPWMEGQPPDGVAQAIPPAYTAFLAEQIAPALMERAA